MGTEEKVDYSKLDIGQMLDFLKGAMASDSEQGSPEKVILDRRTTLQTEIKSLYEIRDSSRMVLWKRLSHLVEFQKAYFFDMKDYRGGSIGKYLMEVLEIPRSTAYSDAKVAKMLVQEDAVSLLDTLKGDRNFKLREIAGAPEGSQKQLLADIETFTRDTLKTTITEARKVATAANKLADEAKKAAKKAKEAADALKKAEESEKENG
jgi:hypothetical protein